MYVVGHVVQLSMLIYQALSDGKLWSPDPSVPMSKPFMSRGTIVLVFWCLTGFWELPEICLRDAHEITGSDRIFSFTELMRLDFFNIILNALGCFGKATRERIDTSFVFFLMLACFSIRLDVIKELTLENDQQELKASPTSPM